MLLLYLSNICGAPSLVLNGLDGTGFGLPTWGTGVVARQTGYETIIKRKVKNNENESMDFNLISFSYLEHSI